MLASFCVKFNYADLQMAQDFPQNQIINKLLGVLAGSFWYVTREATSFT